MNRTATQIVDKITALEKRVAQLEQNGTAYLEARVAELTGVANSILEQICVIKAQNPTEERKPEKED